MKTDRRPVTGRRKGLLTTGKGMGPLRVPDAIFLALLVLASAGALWLVFSPAGMDWLAALIPRVRQGLGIFCVIVGVLGARTCLRLLRQLD